MSNVCIGQYNAGAERWEAIYRGRTIATSKDLNGGPEYLKKVIEGGFSQKAQALGVTKIEIIAIGGSAANEDGVAGEYIPAADMPSVEKEFSINERFEIMESYVEMVAAREIASTVVTGEGGLGKSFTVLRTLKAAGLQDISLMEIGARHAGKQGFVTIKGFSTPKGLFRTLYENRNQIVMFDDCDQVLRDPNSVNILKAALDSYDTRLVTWNSEGGFGGEDDLPKTFEFTGGVIFVSNMPKSKVPQAIRSRAMSADVSMTRDEVVERMRVIVSSDEFMPDYEMTAKLESLEFVAQHAHNPLITELNLRSLVNVVKTRTAKPEKWTRIGLYAMANS
jgi:hypothetical protein